jgi:hypothetical protein
LGTLVGVVVAGVGLALASCSSVSNQRIGVLAPPFSEATFSPVNAYLVARCGTLDCHGAPGRNFRIWGCDGMRLDAGTGVSCVKTMGGTLTTLDEYEATYRSMVGLEPQLMTAVYDGCYQPSVSPAAYPPPSACHPELLTMMEKARGLEAHKGGQLICINPPCPPGVPAPSYPPQVDGGPGPYDPQDVCLVSWLEGQVDQTACGTASLIGLEYGTPADASTE